MPRIQPLEKENAREESRPLMEAGEQNVGEMLNFFKLATSNYNGCTH